jgi:hypothetical protein
MPCSPKIYVHQKSIRGVEGERGRQRRGYSCNLCIFVSLSYPISFTLPESTTNRMPSIVTEVSAMFVDIFAKVKKKEKKSLAPLSPPPISYLLSPLHCFLFLMQAKKVGYNTFPYPIRSDIERFILFVHRERTVQH